MLLSHTTMPKPLVTCADVNMLLALKVMCTLSKEKVVEVLSMRISLTIGVWPPCYCRVQNVTKCYIRKISFSGESARLMQKTKR